MKKKISVIIPAYNCEKYIGRCIDSLLGQKGAELEIIAVNDGSDDNTLGELLKYSDRITVVSIENSGAAGARNAGLSCAHGEFVLFLDSDDCLKDGAVRRLVSAQEENDADIVRFRYECVYSDSSVTVPNVQVSCREFIEKKEFPKKIYPLFFKGIYLNSVCMSMFRRSIIKDTVFRTDMSTAEDAVFSLSAFTKAENVQFITDILYEYNQSDDGLTGRGLSLLKKYRDNFRFAFETAEMLKYWDMDTPMNYARVFVRPLILTLDKIRRLRRKN